MIEQPTAAQLAHNDQVIADINRRLDCMVEIHRTTSEDSDMHPQVRLAGLAEYLKKHSDASSMATARNCAIDRLLRTASPKPGGEAHA